MKSLTTETALDILIAWLQDNIDCESGIIFDNNEDKTDSAALLPCIEQAREDILNPAPTAASAPEPVSLTHHLTHQTSLPRQPEHGWRFHLSAKRNIDYV